MPSANTYSYEWQRSSDGSTWSPIKNTNSTTYTLSDSDVGKYIRVQVSYTDLQGKPEKAYSEVKAGISGVNDATTGLLEIKGDYQEGQSLIADITGIKDDDGLPNANTFTYQWERSANNLDWINISSATSSSYTLTNADANKYVRVKISYTDQQSTTETLTSSSSKVTNVNSTGSGTVSISGTVTEDQTLSASASLSDADGLPDQSTYIYQWLRSFNTSDWISVGSGKTYTLGDADVGGKFKASVTYMDNQGTLEKVLSSATSTVVNVNDVPFGSLLVNGDPTEGKILASDITQIRDNDGLPALNTFTYQWERSSNNSDWSNISSATNSSYTLTNDDAIYMFDSNKF